jgi:hypothetical protein
VQLSLANLTETREGLFIHKIRVVDLALFPASTDDDRCTQPFSGQLGQEPASGAALVVRVGTHAKKID